MNCETIQMDKEAVVAKLEEYESSSRQHEHDPAILAAYRAVAKGRRLIDVNQAIVKGGLNLVGLPKLAIARADQAETRYVNQWRENVVFLWHDKARWSSQYTSDRFRWLIPLPAFGDDAPRLSQKDAVARCPFIPPRHRPKFALSNYFLLWEANWHPAPPVDPYLLRPVVGSLMEIVAEWDVTPLEVAVIAAQRVSR